MGTDAGDVSNGGVCCSRFEGNTVVLVGDVGVADGDSGGGADVETVGIFGDCASV